MIYNICFMSYPNNSNIFNKEIINRSFCTASSFSFFRNQAKFHFSREAFLQVLLAILYNDSCLFSINEILHIHPFCIYFLSIYLSAHLHYKLYHTTVHVFVFITFVSLATSIFPVTWQVLYNYWTINEYIR